MRRINVKRYLCDGIVYCGHCGRKMEVIRHERNGSVYESYVCISECIRAIRVDKMDRYAWDYVKALTQPAVKEQMDAAMQAFTAERVEREIVEARRKVTEVMDALSVLMKKPETIRMPDALLEWLERPLPDRDEMIRQTEEAVRTVMDGIWDVEEYFSVPVPDNPEEQPEEARKAVRWYVERIAVLPQDVEFACTFDGWLGNRLFRRREEERIKRWNRKGRKGKTARACGFEEE